MYTCAIKIIFLDHQTQPSQICSVSCFQSISRLDLGISRLPHLFET